LEDVNAQTLPNGLLPDLEEGLLIIVEERARKIKSDTTSDINKEREAHGLLPFGTICSQVVGGVGPSSETSSDVPTTDCPLLAASTVFTYTCLEVGTARFEYQIHQVSFERVTDLYSALPFSSYLRSKNQPTPWQQPRLDRAFTRDAEAILEALGLLFNVTLAHMNKIASSFKCMACPDMGHIRWVDGVCSPHLATCLGVEKLYLWYMDRSITRPPTDCIMCLARLTFNLSRRKLVLLRPISATAGRHDV